MKILSVYFVYCAGTNFTVRPVHRLLPKRVQPNNVTCTLSNCSVLSPAEFCADLRGSVDALLLLLSGSVIYMSVGQSVG